MAKRWWLVCALAFGLCQACGDDGIAGEECSYECGGQACNLRCVDGVIYRCTTQEVWELEQDCAADDLVCVDVSEPDGMIVSIKCGEAQADAGL